jgi:serine/threonine protein kinase
LDGQLYAIDPESPSQQRWTLDLQRPILTFSASAAFRDTQNTFFIPSTSGEIFAHIPGSGLVKSPLSIDDVIHKCPFLSPDHTLFLASKNTSSITIDMRTGAILSRGVAPSLTDELIVIREGDGLDESIADADDIATLGVSVYHVRAVDPKTSSTKFEYSYSRVHSLSNHSRVMLPIKNSIPEAIVSGISSYLDLDNVAVRPNLVISEPLSLPQASNAGVVSNALLPFYSPSNSIVLPQTLRESTQTGPVVVNGGWSSATLVALSVTAAIVVGTLVFLVVRTQSQPSVTNTAVVKAEKSIDASASGESGSSVSSLADNDDPLKRPNSSSIDTDGNLVVGRLTVSPRILGLGSHGTIVYEGTWEGRAVAVKRMLKAFYDLADLEISTLIAADDHPNVIRYYAKEEDAQFVYLAVEKCTQTLARYIESLPKNELQRRNVREKLQIIMTDVARGLAHLHDLHIVHRDLKPQNVLVDAKGHAKISDMGLAKTLDAQHASFSHTSRAGTAGWQAPEVLLASRSSAAPSSPSSPSSSSSTTVASVSKPEPARPAPFSYAQAVAKPDRKVDPPVESQPAAITRLTRAVDVFSLGLLSYYVFSGGEHLFGNVEAERDFHILKGILHIRKGTDPLVRLAVERMTCPDPLKRPSVHSVLAMPFLWDDDTRLRFLSDVSDQIAKERELTPMYTELESRSRVIFNGVETWDTALDAETRHAAFNFKKYDAKLVRELLRVIRNIRAHYREYPDRVQRNIRAPSGILEYFMEEHRFPRLLVEVYLLTERHFRDRDTISPYFESRLPHS